MGERMTRRARAAYASDRALVGWTFGSNREPEGDVIGRPAAYVRD